MNNRPFLTITLGYVIGIIYGLYLITSIAFYIIILICIWIFNYTYKRYYIKKACKFYFTGL